MAYSANEIREMIQAGNHDEIISAFKQWNEYRSEKFSIEKFKTIQIDGTCVIANGRLLNDEEIRLWLDWCQGITYKDR